MSDYVYINETNVYDLILILQKRPLDLFVT